MTSLRTNPASYDAAQFHARRYTADNLDFWGPHFARLGRITAGSRVTDVGCGTGGLTADIARRSGAMVVGLDYSAKLALHGRQKDREHLVRWVLGDAQMLPLRSNEFDCVIASLVLHQVSHPDAALAEAHRILKPGGRLVVRTVLPEHVRQRVPFRFFPAVAEVEAEVMPTSQTLRGLIVGAGFRMAECETVARNRRLDADEEARNVQQHERPSYRLIGEQEMARGLAAMHGEAEAAGGSWIDPRPTEFMVGVKESTLRRRP